MTSWGWSSSCQSVLLEWYTNETFYKWHWHSMAWRSLAPKVIAPVGRWNRLMERLVGRQVLNALFLLICFQNIFEAGSQRGAVHHIRVGHINSKRRAAGWLSFTPVRLGGHHRRSWSLFADSGAGTGRRFTTSQGFVLCMNYCEEGSCRITRNPKRFNRKKTFHCVPAACLYSVGNGFCERCFYGGRRIRILPILEHY